MLRLEAAACHAAYTAGHIWVAAAQGTKDVVRVESITYSTRGGRLQDRHLEITLLLLDDQDVPVADALITAKVTHDDGTQWDSQGTTGADGTVSFTFINHGSGCYATEVLSVEAADLQWTGPTPE